MKTILHVHIFVRLFATTCFFIGGYQLLSSLPEAIRLRKLLTKQKENDMMHIENFEMSVFVPSLMEVFTAPILLMIFGFFAFVATKEIVGFIIGREQIETLIKLDGTKGPKD